MNKESKAAQRPIALMVPVSNVEAGRAWYSSAFPEAMPVSLPEFGFQALQIGDFLIEIVKSDEKVSSGTSGTVLYWEVDNLKDAISRFIGLGSSLYRGPMEIECGMGMCQITDSFGNLIGLRGIYRI